MPDIVKNSCHNLLIKIGSGSLIIDFGMPWSLMTCFTKCSTTIFAENEWDKATKLMSILTESIYHAPRPTPRAWWSFHTSNPKAYSVTWPKQLSCNRKLPITKYLFRVAEQNLKSLKFNFNTKTSTIQNPLSKYLQT